MESSAQLLPKGDMEAPGKEAAFDPTGGAVWKIFLPFPHMTYC